jgi:hypothetical protein
MQLGKIKVDFDSDHYKALLAVSGIQGCNTVLGYKRRFELQRRQSGAESRSPVWNLHIFRIFSL